MSHREIDDGTRAGTLVTSAREVLLIVAGILIAFALDAWWDERKEQEEVLESLAAVLNDLEASREELETVTTTNTAYKAAVALMLSLPRDGLEHSPDTELIPLAAAIGRGGLTFDPVVGSLQAMISGDRLYQIEDPALRAALAAWPAWMDEIEEDQDILIHMYLAQQERVVEIGLYEKGIDLRIPPSPDQARALLSTALNDELMRNRLAAHAVAVDGLDEELADLSTKLDRLIQQLRSRLTPAPEPGAGE